MTELAKTEIRIGHNIDVLRALPEASVHLGVTSPPYFNQRAYGTVPQVWCGDPLCSHEWRPLGKTHKGGKQGRSEARKGRDATGLDSCRDVANGSECFKCGAWLGELGQEPSPDLFVLHLANVFSAFHRVLRDDGQLWVNLGDSYDKAKNLLGVPMEFAAVMKATGWCWRSCVPWIKWNAMPGSCDDRPPVYHETWLQFTKGTDYYHDPVATRGETRYRRTVDWFSDSLDVTIENARRWLMHLEKIRADNGMLEGPDGSPAAILANVVGLKDEHYAAYPEKLIEPIIRSASSEHGVCPDCLAPWRRKVEKERVATRPGADTKVAGKGGKVIGNRDPRRHVTEVRTVGWEPTCRCGRPSDECVPATVLDPFGGSGTTGRVASKLGRSAILIEIKPDYAAIADRRNKSTELPLFGVTTAVKETA